MKTIKKIVRVTVLMLCLAASWWLLALGLTVVFDNFQYGIGDGDFMSGCFMTTSAIGFLVMTIENLVGGMFHITFEKKEESK